MNTYQDYFEPLDKGYYPEINESSIKDPEVKWQATFPHATFVELLRKTERMLARENALTRHSLWIEGAYGTGKSRIAWTLDHLLTCSPQELNEYFDSYPVMLAKEQDLRQKLLGHKRGKIVTAFRYGSGDINGTEDLVAAVFASLTAALDRNSIPYDTGKTLRGGLAKWLSSTANLRYLENIIQEEPYCNQGCFAGKSARDIRDKLLSADEAQELIKGTLAALRQHGVNTLPFQMNDLTDWIRETIEANHLKALIFIWDEFSDFFQNNRTRLGTFQKLAELSNETPFNLIIVTHYASNLFDNQDQSAKKILDRFTQQSIEMPESIAFQLIQNVLKVKKEEKAEWQMMADDLNSRMERARKEVARRIKGVDQELLKGILPFHPYAALVLKNIAQLFDSNQRSMFNFIVDQDESRHAFLWYIQNHGPESEEDPLLSVDLLWEYFYATGQGRAGARGKSNLDLMVQNILDVLPREEHKLTSQQQRVLKIVLILQALSKKLNNASEFLATEETLRLIFEGMSDLDHDRGLTLAKELVKQGILFMDDIGGAKGVYQAPMSIRSRDMEEIEKFKEEKMRQTRTRELISTFRPEEILDLTAPLRARLILEKATSDNLRTVLNQILAQDAHDYKLRAVLLFARTVQEAENAQNGIQASLADPRAANVLFIDATATIFPAEDFEKWAEASAKMSHFAAKDAAQAANASRDAERLLLQWKDRIKDGDFRVFTAKTPEGIFCPSPQAVLNELQTAVCTRFPLAFDFLPSLPEAVFKSPSIVSIQAGIFGGRSHLPKGTSCVIDPKSEATLLKDAQDTPEYWKKSPELPLSRLKREVDRMITAAFAPGAEGRIAIREVIDTLIHRGFMPNHLSAYLTGFLLREYASSAYRYSDGSTGEPMSQEKLAQLIMGYFKKLNGTEPRYHDCYIEVLTEEQRLFAALAKEVFNLQSNASIDLIAAEISTRVKSFQYPLWCFHALPESKGIAPFIDHFTSLLNPTNASGANSGAIANAIGTLIRDTPDVQPRLKALFTSEKAQEAMSLWLQSFEDGELCRLAQEIDAPDLLQDVRRCFSSDGVWAWDQATGVREVKNLLRDYKIVATSCNGEFITRVNSLPACLDAWREKTNSLRMPYATVVIGQKELKPFLSLLLEIAKGSNLEAGDKRDRFLQELTNHATLIHDFFNGRFLLFKTIYDVQLTGFDEAEKENLFATLDRSAFTQDKALYENTLQQRIVDLRRTHVRGKLVDKWKDATGTASPAEWSMRERTPALALVPPPLYQDAKTVFDAINDHATPNAQVKNAAELLDLHPELLECLQDHAAIDLAFQTRLIGRYATLLTDLSAVRDTLLETLGSNVYAWYGNPRLPEAIRKLAEAQYAHASQRLTEKIDQMSPDTAKTFLKKLIANQMDAGLAILNGEMPQ